MRGFRISQPSEAALERILAAQSSRAGFAVTLDRLLDRWSTFVVEVERGYGDSIYEYVNDLSVRELLNEVVDGGTEELRTAVLEVVRPWDERFQAATSPPLNPLVPGRSHWWLRIPNLLEGEFKDDVLRGGYVADRL